MTSQYYNSPSIPNPDLRLRAGCYLICYTPIEPDPDVLHYDGTLRVQWVDAKGANAPKNGKYIMASGDLYAHFSDRPVSEPSVEQGKGILIPIFPRDEYRFYLCVKSIPYWSITAGGFNMVIESHSYDRYHSPNSRWYSQGQFTAVMQWDLPPPGYPQSALHATGPVYEPGGKLNGTLTMTWISEYLRRAKLVIHQAPGVKKVPNDWAKQFTKFGWQLETEVIENEEHFVQNGQTANIPWTDARLRQLMEQVRKSQQPDQQWRYDLLFVPEILGNERGVTLYHTEDPTCGHVRELATVAAKYEFPTEEELEGDLYNYRKTAGATLESQEKLYVRTSMHELGHAMGLRHNSHEFGFMTTTDELAHKANQPPTNTSVQPFPENAGEGFSQGDLQRLRHWPDFLVRPGTDADGTVLPAITVPVFPDPGQDEEPSSKRELARDVCLHAEPLNDLVPVGAPVRIVYQLICLSADKAQVPKDLGFKSGALSVRVTAPNGSERRVSPIENDDGGQALVQLVAPKRTASAATLLRDDDGGPLFPKSGDYKVDLEVAWWDPEGGNDNRGIEYVVKATCKVTITPPEPEDSNTPPDSEIPTHAEAARSLLATPELQEVLVRHSTLFPAANRALEQAMKCKVLIPHFAYIYFRVLAERLISQDADLEPAFRVLLDANKPEQKPSRTQILIAKRKPLQSPIMTPYEAGRVQDILRRARLPKTAIPAASWPERVKALLADLNGGKYWDENVQNGDDEPEKPTTGPVAKTSITAPPQEQSLVAASVTVKPKLKKVRRSSPPHVKKQRPPK